MTKVTLRAFQSLRLHETSGFIHPLGTLRPPWWQLAPSSSLEIGRSGGEVRQSSQEPVPTARRMSEARLDLPVQPPLQLSQPPPWFRPSTSLAWTDAPASWPTRQFLTCFHCHQDVPRFLQITDHSSPPQKNSFGIRMCSSALALFLIRVLNHPIYVYHLFVFLLPLFPD